MTRPAGYGKAAQDWSYLTPKKALYIQSDVITDPGDIPDEAIIDTTIAHGGLSNSRGRNQTLVIYAIPTSGGALDAGSILYLWINGAPDYTVNEDEADETSTSGDTAFPDEDALGDSAWCLVQAVKLDNNASYDSSLCWVFPWLPAGKYKAAIGASDSCQDVMIVEQHTE